MHNRTFFALLFAASIVPLAGCGNPADYGDGPLGSAQEATKVCLGATTVEGIDVSHYQGSITWSSVASDGIGFAFMKATEGTSYVDTEFASNWSGAKSAGVLRGAYHYYRAASDPVAQANHFLSTVGAIDDDDFPLVIDLEVDDGESASVVASGALTFLQHVEMGTGKTPIVYTGPSFFSSTLGEPAGFGGYPLWIANYGTSCPTVPPTWDKSTIWQDDDAATVTGVSGGADHDLFDGSMSDLLGFIGATQPASSSTASSSVASSSVASSSVASSSVASSSVAASSVASSTAASSDAASSVASSTDASSVVSSTASGGDQTGAGGASIQGNGVDESDGSTKGGCACELDGRAPSSPLSPAFFALAVAALAANRRRR